MLKHRAKRILLPLAVGMVTIVPAMFAISAFVSAPSATQEADPWQAAFSGDAVQLVQLLDSGELKVDELNPASGSNLLTTVAFLGHADCVELLLERGADVNQKNTDGGTALMAATFLGRWESAKILLENGADPTIKNQRGEQVANVLKLDWPTTQYIANMFQVEANEATVMEGRQRIAEQLEEIAPGTVSTELADPNPLELLAQGLGMLFFYFPVFHHLWFLAFLCWLVLAFIVYAWIAQKVGFRGLPNWLVVTPFALVWLLPLTMIPQHFMTAEMFGPDTSIGLLPLPHILLYYAVFFFFGVLYFDSDDQQGRLGRWWFISLPLAILIVFPISMDLIFGTFGWNLAANYSFGGWTSNLLQALFAWLMTFGLLGLFRKLFSGESRSMRYISDSSYWLYVAHLPLMLLVQWWIRSWEIPVFAKLALVCLVVTGILLLTYEYCIRYTLIGSMLNGPKSRTAKLSS